MKKLVLAMMVATAATTAAFAQKGVKNIYASSQQLNVALLQNSEQTVQLNRYLYEGYNTLCLPMSLTAEQLGDIRVERLAAIHQEGNTLNLYFVDCTDDGIQAGVPYLVYAPKNGYLKVRNTDMLYFSDELKAVRMADNSGNVVTFGSAWEAIATDGRYGIPAQQDVTPLESVLIRTTGDKQFLPTRCGFTWDQQASSADRLQIVHAGNMGAVTAIAGIALDDTYAAGTYDQQGRKVSKGHKGIYIQEGKKVAVK